MQPKVHVVKRSYVPQMAAPATAAAEREQLQRLNHAKLSLTVVDLNQTKSMAKRKLTSQTAAVYWNAMKSLKRHNEATNDDEKSRGEQNDSTREERLLSGVLINVYLVCFVVLSNVSVKNHDV
ncbi:hypothetical protein OS493_004426 [Desmophyllum pertusum]|uniref:Uncharacterized protein n=1 Tax=Desmophyllum pertusum TaxID=174260 RepID=A0A9W9ZWS3_9CNID|nr:hypothetical protein OS493_004426 [Desmophyllum pertusum]